MKKIYFYLSLLLGVAISNNAEAQTYSGFGLANNGTIYDTITSNQDTLYFNFTGLPTGATQNGRFVVYYEGDFGGGSEFANGYLPAFEAIGQVGPHPSQSDCAPEDSISLPITTTQLSLLPSTFVFTVITTSSVDQFCTTNRIRVRFEYDYCTFGTPTYATFTIPDNVACPTDNSQTFVGTPSGGTYVGSGMTGNVFSPSNLSAGSYDITYTATDAIGCTTSQTQTISVGTVEADLAITTCESSNPVVNFDGKYHVYSSNLSLSPIIDTAALATFPTLTVSPSTYYSAPIGATFYYVFDTLTIADSLIVDHDVLTGDDRSGIAITDTSIYIVGDNATARYDLDLQNGISIPVIANGIFSDLAQRKIYSLYNTTTNSTPSGSGGFDVNAIIELNADLTVGTNITPLSETVSIGFSNQATILAGYNQLVLGTSYGGEFYKIDISSGSVTALGNHNLASSGSENWAIWGMSGHDNTDFHAYYRSGNTSTIVDYNFGTQTEVNVSDFTDFSDMACFIVHPNNNRLYFHYEGFTSTFGGNQETLGYTTAQDSVSTVPTTFSSIGCPNTITFTFNSINLGADTTVCSEDGVYILEGGFGYSAYSWNGDNSNYNIYPVQDSGQVILEVLDAVNCTLTDTIVVDFNQCTAGVNELTSADLNIYPVPNSGTFTVSFVATTSTSLLMVVDAQGKIVSQQTVAKGETSVSVQTNVEPGIYFVKIVSETGTIQRPIIVQ